METNTPTEQSTASGEKHRRNTGNLRPPWKPGQSGNRKGRPKRQSLTDLAHEYLNQKDPETGEPRFATLVRSLCIGAMKREKTPLHELLARIDPAPSGTNITINNNLRTPIMDALDELGVKRAEQFKGEANET